MIESGELSSERLPDRATIRGNLSLTVTSLGKGCPGKRFDWARVFALAIELRCPDCGRQSQAPDLSAGKRARCKCGAEFRIPAEGPLLATLKRTFAATPAVEPARAGAEHSPFELPVEGIQSGSSQAGSGDPLAALGISLVEQPRREGSLLVMSPEAVLPDRCVKCNAPAEGQRLVVSLAWGPSSSNLFQLAIFCIFSVLWLSSYRAEVEVGICRRHRTGVRRNSALLACGIVAGLAMIAVGVLRGAEYGYVLLAGIVVLFSAPISMSVAGRLLTASRIEPRIVWIKGVCPEFLATLPERSL
jgi:hypothetical protein